MINWSKDKAKVNLVIDAIMLILLMTIAGLGFLIKYVLLPGYKRNALYDGDIELYYLGLSRHEWGNIHLWLGIVFLAFMILHIILHWKMITCIFRKMICRKSYRIIISTSIGMATIFFAIIPFFLDPEISPFQEKHLNSSSNNDFVVGEEIDDYLVSSGRSADVNNVESGLHKKQEIHSHGQHDIELEVNGNMTLNEVVEKYSVPLPQLTDALNVPLSQSYERIGRLKRHYGFDMEELRNKILQFYDSDI